MISTTVDKGIPVATGVDYNNVEEVCGYQLLLCKMLEKAGGLSGTCTFNRPIRDILNQGLIWLKEVKRLIAIILEAPVAPSCEKNIPALGSIPELLSSYDFFYRICNGQTCFKFLRKTRLETVQKWLRGDKSISKTAVTLLIADETDNDIRQLEEKYYSFRFGVQEEWINELTRFGRFHNIPLTEAYQRLGRLLKDDLFVYFGVEEQNTTKRQWVDTYKLEDMSVLDTGTLWKYIGFARMASFRGYLPGVDSDEQYERLFSELASRPDLHPFYREALTIDAETRKAVLA